MTKHWRNIFRFGLALAIVCAISAKALCQVSRVVPKPLPDHPGNVFIEGEAVVVSLPGISSEPWRAIDYDGNLVATGMVAQGTINLGRLSAGYYEVITAAADSAKTKQTSVGVLVPLQAPTPRSSPIALDVAMAWFYPEDKMPAVANLCALAGINWVRDRLNWAEMEPEKGKYSGHNRYDVSAQIQSAAGLQVLQVNHISPAWANPNRKRFPEDLRDAYRFYREMAERWKDNVAAFEPWNEADIEMFGGHTGSEIATYQKTAFLALKSGNPNIIACQNVFALHNRAQLEDFHANNAWPYFDTFNLHHYAPIDAYPNLYADFRKVSAGKPLWVTECDLPVKWSGDEKLKELSQEGLRIQAERVAKLFAASLREGPETVFYFLLPHYAEGQTQFGIIRPDLTPRPAYVALAAVGRLLADAKPLGQMKSHSQNVRAFVMRAKPDGKDRDVLVAWTTDGQSTIMLPAQPETMFDHLGRPLRHEGPEVSLTTAPIIAVLTPGAAGQMDIERPPLPAGRLEGEPTEIVLQSTWPADKVDLKNSAYRINANNPDVVPIHVYNFAASDVSGKLRVHVPDGLQANFPEKVSLKSGERQTLNLELKLTDAGDNEVKTVRIEGDFGAAGNPVLSLRFQL